jgi:hypothetical protein
MSARAAVQDGSAELCLSSGRPPQHRPEILGQGFEATCRQPALRLLIDGRPGWQAVRHPAPGRAGLDDVTQAVEYLVQAVLALSGRLWSSVK